MASETEQDPVARDDPAAGLSVLHVVMTAGPTNSQYNEHCLPVRRSRRITVCSLLPAQVAPPPELRLVEGDGSVRGCFAAVRRALGSGPFDVVHVHAPASAVVTMLVCLATGRSRHGLVLTAHSSWPVFTARNRLLLLLVVRWFPVVVACGRAAEQSFPWYVHRLAHRWEVIPNGVHLDRVDAARPLDDARQPWIVSALRIRPVKDPETLVRAFVAMAPGPQRLRLLGVDRLPEHLAAVLTRGGRASDVSCAGLVSREEVYATFHRSSVFVSTSRGEGLPVSVLEAMACRCPVVLSDLPPHREIADLDGDIPLVPVGDTSGFARQVTRILAMSEHERGEIGERHRGCVREHFSVTAMNRAYGELYRRIADRRPRRAAIAAAYVVALLAGSAAGIGVAASRTAPVEAATITVSAGTTAGSATDGRARTTDFRTLARVVDSRLVLAPVAAAMGIADWRDLGPRVRAELTPDGAGVVLTATGATARQAGALADAVAREVARIAEPERRVTVDVAFARRQSDLVREQLAALPSTPAGHPEWEQLISLRQDRRELESLRDRLSAWARAGEQDRLAVARGTAGPVAGKPPSPVALAGLGALAGLVGVRLVRVVVRAVRSWEWRPS